MNNDMKMDKTTIIISLFFLAIISFLFYSCSHKEANHNDGKCDICGKKATYSSKDVEEYCDEHLEDAIEWYYKQMIEE